MPSNSIDTFFACTLLVSVALIVTASFTAAMQTNIDSLQGINEQNYLKTTAEQLVSNVGSPVDWGSSGTAPESFGLAKAGGSQAYELDIDKISRLNSLCASAVTYEEAARASRLYDIAFHVAVMQMLQVTIESTGNTTDGDITTYSFKVSVAANLKPEQASLQGYIIAKDTVSNVSTVASSEGVGNVSFQLPSASAGQVLLVMFARATVDERLTAYQTYSFTHLSGQGQPNQTFLSLSPLDNKLTVAVNSTETTVNEALAFSFSRQSPLQQVIDGIYQIPEYVDHSPTVIVCAGFNGGAFFAEYTAYPNLPLNFGSSFANTAQNTFTYTVTIRGVLYRLTVTLGETAK